MPVASIQSQPKLNPKDIPLDKIASSKALTEDQKAGEMTRQFEAVLLRQILTEAHKPVIPSKNASAGVSSSIYQDMMVNQMADSISSSRTLGLSQELEKQLSRQVGGKEKPHAAANAASNISGHASKAAYQPPFHPTKSLGR
jgi:Rod binding domain-containing protein